MKPVKTLKALNLILVLIGASLLLCAWVNLFTAGLAKETSSLTIEGTTGKPIENNNKFVTIVDSEDGTLLIESNSKNPLEEKITLHKIENADEFKTGGDYTINQGWIYSTQPVTTFSTKNSPVTNWLLLGSGLIFLSALFVKGVENALNVSNHPSRHNLPYNKSEHRGETGESLMLTTLIVTAIFNLSATLLVSFNQTHGWDFYQILAAIGVTLFLTLICFMGAPIALAIPAVSLAMKISYPSIGQIPANKLKQGIRTEEEIKQWLENKKWDAEIGEKLIENFEGDMKKLVKVTKELAK